MKSKFFKKNFFLFELTFMIFSSVERETENNPNAVNKKINKIRTIITLYFRVRKQIIL